MITAFDQNHDKHRIPLIDQFDRTIQRAMQAHGVERHSDMDDGVLMEHIQNIKAGVGHNWGLTMVTHSNNSILERCMIMRRS
jgi:hypothetical protein